MRGQPITLNTLRDVNPAGIADGKVPIWNATSKTFTMGVPGSSLSGGHDRFVAASTPVATYTLTYLPTWINALAKAPAATPTAAVMLAEGHDYTVNYSTGVVTLATVPTTGDVIIVSYVTAGSLLALPSGGLVAWWRASDLGVADGTAIGTWTDATANHWTATQSSAGAKPTYRAAPTGFGGQPALQFVGASSQYVSAAYNAALNPAALTMIAVFQPNALGVTDPILSSHEQSAGTSGYQLIVASSPAGRVEGLLRSSLGTAGPICGAISTGATTHWATVTTTGSGTNGLGYLDGTVGGTATAGDLAVNTTDPFIIGYDPNFGSPHAFDGYIAEVILYNRVLTGTERTQADNYIKAKYGL